MARWIPPTISVVGFLLIWESFARMRIVPIALFPPPTSVFYALAEMWRTGDLVRDLTASLWRAIVGLAIGSLIGIGVGLVTGRSRTADNYLTPLIQLFRPLPPVALIPLMIVWFGIGEVSKVFSISFAVFFPVWINSHIGAREVPKTYLWSAQTFKLSSFAKFSRIIFPSALTFIIAGFRNGIAVAFVMVFVSELAGASEGVGYQISISHLAYRIDRMIAALIVLGTLGAVTDLLLTRSARAAFPWLRFSEQP